LTWVSVYRLLGGWQGIVGLGCSLALALALVIQKGETRHWNKQSVRYEQLYRGEKAAHESTVANYRQAAAAAAAQDRANAVRVQTEQATINERTTNDLEARLADARARYARLHASAAADSSGRPGAPVPAAAAAQRGVAQAAGQDGLPAGDALIATEQAIQLDELIKAVRAVQRIDTGNGPQSAPRARSEAIGASGVSR
jgi:hypothetical protein